MLGMLSCLRRRALPFVVGAAIGSVWMYYRTADPNRDFDPQAASNYFCHREVVAQAPMPEDSEWEVTAYHVYCTVIGTSELIYVYLLRAGQTAARSTLVISYDGLNPTIQWKDKDTLVVHAKFYSVIRQVSELMGVRVEYDLQRVTPGITP